LENPKSLPTQSGSGLKRPLELGEDGFPVFNVRKKKRKIAELEELPWEGFGSEDDAQNQSSDQDEEDEGHANDSLSEISESSSNEESSASESSEEEDPEEKRQKKARTSAFKEWATQQMNEVLEFRPSDAPMPPTPQDPRKPQSAATFVARALESDPLPRELQADASKDLERKAFSVQVDRSTDIQEARLGLPIVAEEQKIMEAIHNNSVVVVWGATGSGKTTQVPQFLFESGFGDPNGPTPGMIGLTQPRRVAAVSMAMRVGD